MLLTGDRSRWLATIVLGFDQLVAWGILYYAYAVLSAPIAADLAVSRQLVASGFAACLLVSGLLARPVGVLLDRGGTKPALIAGAALGVVALSMIASAQTAASLLTGFALLGVAQAHALYEPAFRTLIDWFPAEPGRSRALLVVTSIGGLASTVFLPLTTHLIEELGWRTTLHVLAAGLAVVLVPARLLLPLPPPTITTAAPASRQPWQSAASARWLAAGFSGHAFVSTGVLLYLVWLLVERGQSVAAAAAVTGLCGAAQVPGRLLLSVLRGRSSTRLRLPLLFGVQALALSVVAAASPSLIAPAALVFGAASGIMTLERARVLAEWYGSRSYGTQSGRVVAPALIARAVSPFAVQAAVDLSSYGAVFAALAGVLVLGGACVIAAANARRLEIGGRSTEGEHPTRVRLQE